MLPVVNVVLPAGLFTSYNGNLPASMMVSVGPSGQLHHTAARAWRALQDAAAADGIPLTYTYGGTYRSYADQIVLFQQRYSTVPQPGGSTKVWKSTTYWLKPHMAMAATPGTSNHGLGLAVDTALGFGPSHAESIVPRLPWMLANTVRFGWSYEAQSEPWHIRYVAGDAIPIAVLEYEASLGLEQEDDVSIKILRSIKDEPDFYAQFIAVCDAQGHSIEVQWSGPGDDPKCAKRMADLRAAGVKDANIELIGLRNNTLHPRYRPEDIQDSKHPWTADDFA